MWHAGVKHLLQGFMPARIGLVRQSSDKVEVDVRDAGSAQMINVR